MHMYVYIHNGWMIGGWMDGWIDSVLHYILVDTFMA